jgi:hypothetical protein
MASLCRLIAIGCLLVGFCADAQVGGSRRGVVLPSPQLIHCHSVECSHLWNKDGGPADYPAQVLTDVVNGEVVGLTAVYDKSVSVKELQSAIDMLYPKAAIHGLPGLWRVEAEQLVIQLSDRNDGTKQLIYLKILKKGTNSSLVPSAHITDPTK